MFNLVALLPLAACVCASCSGPAAVPLESLVGATELPSAAALSRETLYITRGANDSGGDRLTYELRPSGSLIVAHTYSNDREPGSVERGQETLELSVEVAARVRQLFWRVRPGKLEGQGLEKAEVRPVGCQRRGPHDFGEIAVAFVNEDSRPEQDGQAGIFELPSAASCNAPAALEARKVVWRALRMLPQSRVVMEFERTS